MNLLDKDFFLNLRNRRNTLLIVFIILTVILTATYILSFLLNNLWLSMGIGVVSVTVLVLFFYGLIFDKNKLLKFYSGLMNGITQEDTYTFIKTDDITEHDGVRLLRLLCSFEDSGEVFERTLYFLCDLPHPALEHGQKIKVKTHRNIIVNIED